MSEGRLLATYGRLRSRSETWIVLACVALAYLPVVFSSPGDVGADTKTYLYMDPGRVLSEAGSLWDSDSALGTVTHQNIGYLWPMGPFYWVLEVIGSPDWLAQRLWLGTLIAAAGLGVRYLLRTLDWSGPGLLVAMLAYQLSPYLLDYSARISVVLLPWAGLPWMIALTIKSVRSEGWRYPALFALTVVTVGSVNATSLVLVGLAPLLWLTHAVFAERSIAGGRALAAAVRMGVLTVATSLWWIAGLLVQGRYSLPVVRYTETYEVVADAATAPEILRGLGYWFFYGNDKFGAWIEPSVEYTQGGWLIFISFGLVVLAIGSAAFVRWQHRSYFLLLLFVGALVAVASHPFDSPSMLGAIFKDFTRSDAGLAMRSTPRAVPLVALATSVLLASSVNALVRHHPRIGSIVGSLVVIVIVLNNPAMWRVRMIEDHLHRSENIPTYWNEAATALDRVNQDTRVWEMPGSDFASYRWGNTVDPITPGLIDRGYVARELVPFGSAESAGLVGAVDRRLQEDTLDPRSVAPIARLLSVGDVLHRADLTFERFRTPRPVETAELFAQMSDMDLAGTFGPPSPNVAGPEQTMLDEVHLARAADVEHPAPLSRFEVDDPLPVVRARSTSGATVLVGDADGIVDAAAAGVLDVDRTIVFGADLVADSRLAATTLASPAEIVITDSNRRRARRWGTIREIQGYTERAGEEPLSFDPTDNRLPLFEHALTMAGDDIHTVSEQRGPVVAEATAYGNPVTYTLDDRPSFAVDGLLDTAWVVAAFDEARGERLRLTLAEAQLVPTLRLVQPREEANRRITEVAILADSRLITVQQLSADSLTTGGQTIELNVNASVIEIEITDTDVPRRATYPGVSPVGFAEVDLGLGPVLEVIRTPRALVDMLGPDLADHGLSVVLTRERSNPREPVRSDPEDQMRRVVPLPEERSVTLSGTARLSAHAPSDVIDSLLGTNSLSAGAVHISSSGRLAGDLPSRASVTLDGVETTAWTGEFGPQSGQWLEYSFPSEMSEGDIEIDVVVDILHSVPQRFRVIADGVDLGSTAVGLTLADNSLDSIDTVIVSLDSPAKTVRLIAESVDERLTRDWYSNTFQAMPISIAEVRLPGEAHLTAPQPVDTGCRDDLVSFNGTPVPVRVSGSAEDALARRGLQVEGCAPAMMVAGETLVETAPGFATGIDIDQLTLRSLSEGVSPADPPTPLDVVRHSDTHFTATVPASSQARWLVLGQSHNEGWVASVGGTDLEAPVVIDGFANGWLIPGGGDLVVELRWTPQRVVDWALRISLLFVALTLFIVFRGRRSTPSIHGGADLGPALPTLLWPFGDIADREVSTRAGVVASFGVTAIALVNLPQWPLAAGFIGIVLAVALFRPRFSIALPLLAALSLGVAALYVLIEQYRFRHPPDFVWPQQFEEVHILGVLTILLVMAEYAREVISGNRR